MKKFLAAAAIAVTVLSIPSIASADAEYRNLPAGYTQLECITNRASAIIDTGVAGSLLVSAEFDWMPHTDSLGCESIGFIASSRDNNDWRFFTHSSGWMFDISSSRLGACNDSKLDLGIRRTVELGNCYFRVRNVDGTVAYEKVNASISSAVDACNIGLCGCFKNTALTNWSKDKATWYGAKFYDGGVLIRDYVPAKRDSDDVVGLYDVCNSQFYGPHNNTGSFLAGEVVHGIGMESSVSYTDGDWKLSVTVTGGESGDLYLVVADAAGGATTNLLASAVTPSETPIVRSLGTLESGAAYSVSLLSDIGGYIQLTTVASIFNGGVTIAKVNDGDRATAASGIFRISLANNAVAGSDLEVAYALGAGTTAVSGTDFATLSGTAVIPAGSDHVDFSVIPLPSGETEDKVVEVALSAGAYFLGSPASATLTIAGSSEYGGWLFDASAGTMKDMNWQFAASGNGADSVIVGTVNADSTKGPVPTEITALDFSKPVVDSSGNLYKIITLNPNIRNVSAVRSYVGELTMPGEGLFEVGGSAFGECANATGELVFPSTLKILNGAAFYKSTKLTCDASKLPSGITTMGVQVFTSTGLYGDLRLPSVSLTSPDFRDTFLGTKVTSVYLGPHISGIWGASNQGAFQSCSELTNVVFDANGSYELRIGSAFCNCPKLEELDLSSINNMNQSNGVGHVANCTKLRKLTFSSKLNYIDSDNSYLFSGDTALSEIVFTGPPPAHLGTPYINGLSQCITTIVTKAALDLENSAGMSWRDYAANGIIRHKHSTFASEYINVDGSKRLLICPEISVGLVMIVR